MTARPANVTQAEVVRTIKGALEAGLRIGRLEVNPRTGAINVFPEGSAGASTGPAAAEAGGRSSCDDAFGM